MGREEKKKSRVVAFGRNYCYPINSNNVDTIKDNNDDDELQLLPPAAAVCTAQSTVILNERGKIFQMGTMHGRIYPHWTEIRIPLPVQCQEIAAGRHFCVARMEGGVVLTWGAGHFGQLGIGDCSTTTWTPQPILVERLLPAHTGSPVTALAAGDWHALALTEAGTVWAWGSNRSYQCGQQQPKQPSTVPAPLPIHQQTTTSSSSSLPLLPRMQKIAAGRSHSCALSLSGQVYCWGNSSHGQCGVATRRGAAGVLPGTAVEGLPTTLEMVQIAAAGHSCLALSKAGRVFGWGDGREGQLGLAVRNSTSTGSCCTVACFPQQVSKPRLIADLDFVAVAAGQEWKQQQQQQKSTSAAEALSNIPRVTSIYAAPSYSAAISSSGHLYCWGSNDVGQLGLETPSFLLNESDMEQRSDDSSRGSDIEREIHVQTFDSRHNVLLPVRVQAVDDMVVESLAVGPNHMWCFGRERAADERNMVVGRTLYEVQEEQRLKRLARGAAVRMNTLSAIRAKQRQQQEDDSTSMVEEDTTSSTDVGVAVEDESIHSKTPLDSSQEASASGMGVVEGNNDDYKSKERPDAATAVAATENTNRISTTDASTRDGVSTSAIVDSITRAAAATATNNAIVQDASGRTSSSSSSSSSSSPAAASQEVAATAAETSAGAPAVRDQVQGQPQESGLVTETSASTASNAAHPPKSKKRRGLIKRLSKGLRRRWSNNSEKKGEVSTMGTDENATNCNVVGEKVVNGS